MVMLLSLVFCYIAITYFGTPDFVVKPIDKVNIIYSAPFFIAGGMVYLYRHGIKGWVEKHWVIALMACIALTVLRFIIDIKGLFVLPDLIVFATWLMYAIGSKDMVLNNRIVKYLSGISMEIYLCHMMFYRVVSMIHLDKFIGQCDVLYVVTCIGSLIGAICFSHIVKYDVFPFMEKKSSFFLGGFGKKRNFADAKLHFL